MIHISPVSSFLVIHTPPTPCHRRRRRGGGCCDHANNASDGPKPQHDRAVVVWITSVDPPRQRLQ